METWWRLRVVLLMVLYFDNYLAHRTSSFLDSKPLDQRCPRFLSATESEGNADITPNTYQDLPPLNQDIYMRRSAKS